MGEGVKDPFVHRFLDEFWTTMSKFQRIYWSRKFDWKRYAKLYSEYSLLRNNYYTQSANVLLDVARLKEGSKIIDLACGTGVLSKELVARTSNIHILAVDLSSEMLHYYRQALAPSIRGGTVRVVSGNAEQINKYTKDRIDIVFVASALWDLELEPLIRSLKRVVKSKGRIVFNLPDLVVGKEAGFIYFIEHFFRQALHSSLIYRRIKVAYLKKIFSRYGFKLVKQKPYSFKLSKQNVARFFDLLSYRYPFILFPKNMPYLQKLRRCVEIFHDSLRYIPKDGIKEEGFVFVMQKV